MIMTYLRQQGGPCARSLALIHSAHSQFCHGMVHPASITIQVWIPVVSVHVHSQLCI